MLEFICRVQPVNCVAGYYESYKFMDSAASQRARSGEVRFDAR